MNGLALGSNEVEPANFEDEFKFLNAWYTKKMVEKVEPGQNKKVRICNQGMRKLFGLSTSNIFAGIGLRN